MASSNAKLPSPAVGNCVLLPVSEFDRGRLDTRNIPGVVSEVTEHGFYRIATRHGVVNTTYSRNQLHKSGCQLLDLEDTIPEVHSFCKIASLHSALGGHAGLLKVLFSFSFEAMCMQKTCHPWNTAILGTANVKINSHGNSFPLNGTVFSFKDWLCLTSFNRNSDFWNYLHYC